MADADLTWATNQYKMNERRRKYELYWNYYEGNQRLAFATEKFKEAFGNLFKEFAENVCPAVVDSLVDRLQVVGFRSSAAALSTEPVPSLVPGVPERKKVTTSDPKGQDAWDIWERNRMDLRSKDVHRESVMMGDSYAIVWPDENMQAAIWPQLANEVTVQYDPNTQGKLLRGAKRWFDDVEARWMLNVYLRDAILKFESRNKTVNQPEKPEGYRQIDEVSNPYDVVPVFHFPRGVQNRHGRSDLKDVIPIQDALNKAVMDMLIAMEFASFKQRYVIGLEVEIDEETGEPKDANAKNYGVDRMMAIPNEEAKVGQFDATDLTQFLKVQEKFWASVARVSGTPLHYFFITQGDFPSGEAQKAAEARFSTRIEDSQTSYGNTWEDVMRFAMQIDGTWEENLELTALWTDATPRSDSELADTAVKKKAVGFSRSYLLSEFGLSDEEIDRMLQESDAEAIQKFVLQQPPESGQQGENGSTQRSTAQPAGENTRGVRR